MVVVTAAANRYLMGDVVVAELREHPPGVKNIIRRAGGTLQEEFWVNWCELPIGVRLKTV